MFSTAGTGGETGDRLQQDLRETPRLHPRAAGVKVNCCCPGYCDTDMSSHRGPRSPHDGAQNAVILATLPSSELPSGEFYQNRKLSRW